MQWSPLQERALVAVHKWLKSGSKEPFYLAGYAGTGKTTLAKHFASGISGPVYYAAYTGKAAYVMRQRGCDGASTIHSLIYKPVQRSKDRLFNLQEELAQLIAEIRSEMSPDEDPEYVQRVIDENKLVQAAKEAIRIETQGLKKPMFELNVSSPLRNAKLLIVDECSMVDKEMGEDILSFGCPVLVLGDPAQLPPVRGTGYFTSREPDILLTEIHRQARDNPIIDMATTVRQGRTLELGEYGDSLVISLADGEPEMYTSHDQILCGREKKTADPIYRRNLNARVRTILGRKSIYPEPGDRLVCLRNNHEAGLLNGSLWKTLDSVELGDTIGLTLEGEDGHVQVQTAAHAKLFRGEELSFWEADSAEHFDFGYAMTVHKAQGSQWDSVLLFDQSRVFRNEAHRWLYTAITRAAKRITVIRC